MNFYFNREESVSGSADISSRKDFSHEDKADSADTAGSQVPESLVPGLLLTSMCRLNSHPDVGKPR